MRILAACTLPDDTLEHLRALGVEVDYRPDVTSAALPRAIRDVGMLIVDRRPVSPEVIRAGRSLQMILRAGTSVSNIAIDEACTHGVFVCNCPNRDVAGVAEWVFALILAIDRDLVAHADALAAGRLAEATLRSGRGLVGRTLGVIGSGALIREVARRARGFEMRTLAYQLGQEPEPRKIQDVEFCQHPRELARRSDIVAIYGSPDRADEVIVNSEFVQSMPLDASLVHIGHPGVLDEAAVKFAIDQRQLRVASDVYAAEFGPEGSRFRSWLLDQPGVLTTHRLANASAQALAAVAAEVVRVARHFFVSGEVLNCVNLLEHSPATWQLLLRLRDAPGVLAAIMDVIRADGVNAEEVNSRVFRGARAAWCSITLDERPSSDALEAIRKLDGVLHSELRAVV